MTFLFFASAAAPSLCVCESFSYQKKREKVHSLLFFVFRSEFNAAYVTQSASKEPLLEISEFSFRNTCNNYLRRPLRACKERQ